ncbi:MAG: LptF/LptG family permease [Hyphomicrobiaceae bacterium]|nr:LptF/LptG family permease [Hyphomicrobiaceae bacterium]MCC0024692.1 LptF/LptG family permease [Hyphomicrobiaceae bacterium]
MSRLTRYLLGQFLHDAIALCLIAATLVWLTNMLELFDLVTAKGQGLITLAGQAFLATPALTREILYICMAIGLARAFAALQNSRELHTIHITDRVRAIWGALVWFSVIGVVLVEFLAHWAEPVATRSAVEWQAQIAAELVGENLTPGRFTEISDGVVVRIGPRLPDGTITNFFADDSRSPTRRTYFADTAVVIQKGNGYQISLRDGRVETKPVDDKYTEVAFSRYELEVDSLTEVKNPANDARQRSTLQLIEMGRYNARVVTYLHKRTAEALRIVAIFLLVASFMMIPNSARRQNWMSAELFILVTCFAERSLSNLAAGATPYGHYLGPLLMLIAGVSVATYRFRVQARPRNKRVRGAAS